MDKLLFALKRPKLDIQLSNDGDDNQSCHIVKFKKKSNWLVMGSVV